VGQNAKKRVNPSFDYAGSSTELLLEVQAVCSSGSLTLKLGAP